MASGFLYNPLHQVVVCRSCGTCLIPTLTAQERHLRAQPHRLQGDPLKTTVQLLSSYQLRTTEELRHHKPAVDDQCLRIEGLKAYDGYRCLGAGCSYYTRCLPEIKRHAFSTHQKQAKEHKEETPLWQDCTLQTYFIGKGRIDYFVVVRRRSSEQEGTSMQARSSALLTDMEKTCFAKLERDYQTVQGDIEEQANIV
jgi:hypothetical protein